MKKEEEIHIAKFFSLILRHKPQVIGLSLDGNGWASVYDLILKTNQHDSSMHLDFEKLQYVVNHDNKQRFALSPDNLKIRANQGHSLKDVDMEFEEVEPPLILLHGTAKKNIDGIKEHGLLKMSRQYVHLTSDHASAVKTGKRFGDPIVLIVNSQEMWAKGFKFFLSDNNVWLTEKVPPQFITF